jgi:putative transposase
MLSYKTRWRGSALIEASRWYPSTKTCSVCGTVKAKLPLAERNYRCAHCGAVSDRDLNAAINLARHGEAELAKRWPAGSGPVAGRGATHKTQAAAAATAGGCETSTPHSSRPAAGKTGTALRKERLPESMRQH